MSHENSTDCKGRAGTLRVLGVLTFWTILAKVLLTAITESNSNSGKQDAKSLEECWDVSWNPRRIRAALRVPLVRNSEICLCWGFQIWQNFRIDEDIGEVQILVPSLGYSDSLCLEWVLDICIFLGSLGRPKKPFKTLCCGLRSSWWLLSSQIEHCVPEPEDLIGPAVCPLSKQHNAGVEKGGESSGSVLTFAG